jgi:flagella basal body P-ring formation protein FlgA
MTERLLLAAALLAMALPAAPQPSMACHPITADWIYGRDLVAAAPSFAGLPPELPVSHSPVPGLERIFHPAELRRLAEAHHLSGATIVENICFAWPLAPLTRERIAASIEHTLAGRHPLIEPVDWSLAAIPAGELVFPLSGLSALSDKPVIWKGYVAYAGNRRFSTWANVRVAIRESHLISTVALRVGESVSPAEVRTETYEGPLPREKALTSPDHLTGLRTRRDIPAGVTLFDTLFEIAKEVERNELVTVLVEAGSAHIETQGVAEWAGRRGDIISVRNPKTGRVYRARIEDKGTVRVVPGGAVGLVVEEKKKTS